MTKNLVIVESPAKAKTIQKYLGSDYLVESSFGHIRDLPRKTMAVDINNSFKPKYEVPPEKKKTVRALRQALSPDTTVWLATDEDREGEAIAWHLKEVLKLNPGQVQRIVFHEITKPAILKAIANPRQIDKNLVDAQQARRVLDRLVGYELSPVLWRKIRRGLSAGRVQSVAVRLIVEREREIDKFKLSSDFKLSAEFASPNGTLSSNYVKSFPDEATAKQTLKSLVGRDWQISDTSQTEGKRQPPPPFTTSTLQQEAGRRLGYSVKQTMMLAQRLYESGKITYMRTDSLNLSSLAVSAAAKYIETKYGSNYLKTRHYKTKSAGAQEAHEAIRPTDFTDEQGSSVPREQKLYSLIRSRTLASQMAPARFLRSTIKISSGGEHLFTSKGEVLVFDGWLASYGNNKSTAAKQLPEGLAVGQSLELKSARADQTYARPPARYNEAMLVKKLEELGVGRPSTYAPTISTIQDRGYVEKRRPDEQTIPSVSLELIDSDIKRSTSKKTITSDKKKLLPTDVALVVNDFLVEHFGSIVDYKFTAKVEKDFDRIAVGQEVWQTVIKHFYDSFHKLVEKSASVSRQDAAQSRQLGVDPTSGKPVFARFGRYGPMVQLGEATDKDKPKFAALPKNESVESVSLEKALQLLSLPRLVGKTEDGKEVKANIGRYGPYVQIDKTYAPLPSSEDVYNIDLKHALELLDKRKQQIAKKYIKQFKKEKIDIIDGRYGPYITDGKKNVKVPKDQDPKTVTLDQAKALLKTKS